MAEDVKPKSTFVDGVEQVYQDGKKVVSTVYNDSKDMVSFIYPEIKSAIVEIARALGIAAEHVYIVLVKKYLVDGIKELFVLFIGLVLGIFGIIYMNKYLKSYESIEWHILWPAGLLAVAFIVMFSVDYNAMFMGLINPEWGAIDYILEYSKSVISNA
jgi:H+/Cl- antiporter ClcA